MTAVRAIVIKESLTPDAPPELVGSYIIREYHHELDANTPITIVESAVDPNSAAEFALQLSRSLKSQLFYAHIIDDERMLLAFPQTVVEVRRNDRKDEVIAQRIGELFSIPIHQMQFLAMFERDHPDAGGPA